MTFVPKLLAALTLIPATYGQSGGISVTVSRAVTLALDEVDFAITVTAEQAVTIGTVINMLADNGVTAKDLISQGLRPDYPDSESKPSLIQYNFIITRPASGFQTATATFETQRKNLPKGVNSLTYSASFRPNATAVDEARSGLLAPLTADARQKARIMADAAGLTLGEIESMSDSNDYSSYYGAYRSTRVTFTLNVRFAKR